MYYFPSTWRRFLAHFIDQAYVSILQLPVWIKISMDYIHHEQLRVHWSHLLYLILVSFLYEVLSLSFFSTTLGKSQLGLKVISREKKGDDDSVRWDQAILRALTSRLSFFFGWSIYALAFLKINRTHLADWLAETQVVSVKERDGHPRIRWILAVGFVLLTLSESLKTASVTLNSIKWQGSYLHYDSYGLKTMLDDIEFRMDSESDDD